ncbi:hypothetical protein Y032_0012g1837 [Ancylostoma ceylanicum]|uniref:C-type lectin domain-containing protein n=1 Tax=Ancylostoma ceylanicum TaxID=53326 RepID=A0A016VD37_9BILA|nr:hypothetical protein Y032_0012g1837 [Ancylostoma ceylanicum]
MSTSVPALYVCCCLLVLLTSISAARNEERIEKNECPRGWTRYDRSKSCFLVLPQRLRWAEAERACGKSGGRLASITDEYENAFVFNLAKKANLTTPTVWLGRLVRLARTGAYEWHDGAIGRQADGFREPPSGTELCLTMWLDFDRPEGSWNEWDCGYASGYSALCKKSLKKPAFSLSSPPPTDPSGGHVSQRCCVQPGCGHRCSANERCIPDDLNCWWRTCSDNGMGWCLPLP